MRTLLFWLLPLVATVSGTPLKPTVTISTIPKSPLSPFDKRVIRVFNSAGEKSMDLDQCYLLVRSIYRKVGRAAIILPPSKRTVQKLLPKDPLERISRADFVNLARELRQSILTGLAILLSIPPMAMIVATQVPDEVWLSFDLWIVDFVHTFMPALPLPVISSFGMLNNVLAVCLVLIFGNALIGTINTVLWIAEGKDQSVVRPSVPIRMIPAEPLTPPLAETHHPEPISDVPQASAKVEDSNAFIAPLLVASTMGGVAAFSLPLTRHTAAKDAKAKPTATVPAKTKAATQTKSKKKDESSDELMSKKEKPPVGRIAGGAAIVGCLQYAATVARFVGVLLP